MKGNAHAFWSVPVSFAFDNGDFYHYLAEREWPVMLFAFFVITSLNKANMLHRNTYVA